jgi:hypothetical protein
MQPELSVDACFPDAEAFGELAIDTLTLFMSIDHALTEGSWKRRGHHHIRPSFKRPPPAGNPATIHLPRTQPKSIHFARRRFTAQDLRGAIGGGSVAGALTALEPRFSMTPLTDCGRSGSPSPLSQLHLPSPLSPIFALSGAILLDRIPSLPYQYNPAGEDHGL